MDGECVGNRNTAHELLIVKVEEAFAVEHNECVMMVWVLKECLYVVGYLLCLLFDSSHNCANWIIIVLLVKSSIYQKWLWRCTQSKLLYNLDYVFVQQLMLFSHLLWVEFDRGAPHHRISEVFDHVSVDFHAKVFDSGPSTLDDDRCFVVWVFAFGFGVDTDKVKVFPHAFDELVKIPAEVSCNRNIMLDLVEDV